jgi:Cell division protein FtsI/penicillin-binding protein 2
VKEGMRWAVTGQNSPHASCLALNDLPVAAAAKTGTAQVSRPDCKDCYTIWISVFAPYEDPKIVLTIMLEDVKGRLSQVVVPVAKEVLNWYFSR